MAGGHPPPPASVASKEDRQLLKDTETPEEKYRRRMEKKQQKAERKAKDEALLGYTNESNPFNDSNLSETFIWKKKVSKLAEEGTLDPQWRKRLKGKREELRAEIDEVKARRTQREREREQMDVMRAEVQRQEEARNAVEFEKRGEAFDVRQIKMRRDVRLKEGRAMPIDFLSKNFDILFPEEREDFDGYQLDAREPHQLVEGLTRPELESLRDDVKRFVVFEQQPKAQDYWKAMLLVTEDAIEKLRAGGAPISTSGVHPSVMAEQMVA